MDVEVGLPAERVQAAHRSFGSEFPSLQDERFQTQQAYSVSSIPTLVLIDRSGMIRHLETGIPDEDALAEVIDTLIAEPR